MDRIAIRDNRPFGPGREQTPASRPAQKNRSGNRKAARTAAHNGPTGERRSGRPTPAVLGGTAGILLAPAMFLADPRCTGGLFIAAFVAMMIVPGHILNRRSKNAR